MSDTAQKSGDPKGAVASNPFWYHTMELAPGVVTPGWFDLRPIVDVMPWPDVRGKRCLDVGPYDGYLSFELERRGASEVLAADIGSPWEWDWPLRERSDGPPAIAAISGAKTGKGFEVAKEILGSSVERVELSIYDLSPEEIGRFDVVVCGSLLLHLRDPIRALEAIRSVCTRDFLSAEQISMGLSLLRRKKSAAVVAGGERCQWWIPNIAAHRTMLVSGGFQIERTSRPYAIRLGESHPARGRFTSRARDHLWPAPLLRGVGVPHIAVLCRPDPAIPA